ncbi:MAG: undecaprenyldiphospho-muramoylpentapeptide beta-N-acetylglucosaminyltransferase [Paludibacteraceae bacterium]|nr:undecaprenyldiphospho-muramoylpentapeptide beta-N-acetylglucosaminyltransferase [Paludibacteraceae bacterium]MDD6747575.1 undecaprenyldiphospho-muramoylpentapeptide beta-N-acetylglucosaminyltransferase [Paludibacteraceae bacterium]
MRYLISGGGTGGHIFPAVSIANALKELDPEAEILFVGALGRMEMERVPQAGYEIVGLPVRGFDRKKPWKNVSVLIDLSKSIRQVKKIIRDFKPNVGVGVGGYASGAAMWAAAKMGIPILLQEQNGFAGVTNKILKDKAAKICVAYEGMEKFFPADKIILTGNPVRQNLLDGRKSEDDGRKTLLIIGGSLGARTINEAVIAGLKELTNAGIKVVWQTGKVYYEKCKAAWEAAGSPANIECLDFLSDMPDRYANADLVVSRAGASSISEICLLGKPAILVPSPNVAEDHQTHNAMALVNKDAAVLVRDAEAAEKLIATALELLNDPKRLKTLQTNVLKLAQKDSAKRIAEEVIALAKK